MTGREFKRMLRCAEALRKARIACNERTVDFVSDLNRQFDETGELTDRQLQGLENIIKAFEDWQDFRSMMPTSMDEIC